MKTQTILVTGATGNVGHHIATQLADTGLTVRALTRDPSSPRLPGGVIPVAGDLASPDSLRDAAAGADAAFLLWPFRTAEGAAAAVDALASQVRRIVFLSAINVRDGGTPEENGMWGEVERAIERSGVEWTFLRAGGFAANTLGWADQIRAEGVVHWVHGAAARSLIHERDIADVAVLALTDDEHVGAKYLLTGPEAITQVEQARILGEAIGLPVRWEEIPPEAATELMTAFTGDRTFAQHAVDYWASLIAEPELVTQTVAEVTGHLARTFREWARDHADEFRPRSAQEVIGRYTGLLREGDFTAATSLLAADVVRIAPVEGPAELRGVTAIMENGARLTGDYEISGVEVDGPHPFGDRFALRFTFDEVHLPSGKPHTVEKLSLYTVSDGRITTEHVYYHTPPPGIAALGGDAGLTEKAGVAGQFGQRPGNERGLRYTAQRLIIQQLGGVRPGRRPLALRRQPGRVPLIMAG
jgi:uncharacterized protein YbjT (DUF2867 family)